MRATTAGDIVNDGGGGRRQDDNDNHCRNGSHILPCSLCSRHLMTGWPVEQAVFASSVRGVGKTSPGLSSTSRVPTLGVV